MSDGRCRDCKHWLSFDQAWAAEAAQAAIDHPPGWLTPAMRDPRRMDLQSSDKRLGLCQKISGIEEKSEEAASALALAEDSSDYIRNLRTRAEFGCVLFERRE